MARVYLTDDAKEDLRDFDGSARKIIIKALAKLKENPEQRGQPLGSRTQNNLTTFRKLVIGDRAYRAVYRVENDGTVAVIWVIKERADNECYEIAVSRLRLHGDREMADLATNLLEGAWQVHKRNPTQK
ncbi:type II toxin-antitoxin system RelE family toxin [Amycolatopsis keratiniphila]|uniref:type II toxin-antitoxin system RelE family toxin n=1 Tax=Amycolatopsis keratiniphila TaxID=129921 RepID=UPI0009DFD4D9|nr:type II toxin-antitoxin system RelE/ParE family toxin [Amycolatopsis keratiniphila]